MSQLFETVNRVNRSAEISECGRYRWWLRREWTNWGPDGQVAGTKGVVCFVMLNPSTADALQDDPAIRRCIGFAKSWGYDTLSVRNLFPWRATDPKELRNPDVDVFGGGGGGRGEQELLAACTADLLVAAWGAGSPFYWRGNAVLNLWRQHFPQKEVYCLGTTTKGYPRHPLYVRGDQQPVLFTWATG